MKNINRLPSPIKQIYNPKSTKSSKEIIKYAISNKTKKSKVLKIIGNFEDTYTPTNSILQSNKISEEILTKSKYKEKY